MRSRLLSLVAITALVAACSGESESTTTEAAQASTTTTIAEEVTSLFFRLEVRQDDRERKEREQVRLDVRENRFLRQIEADDGRHVGVDRLVVGHPGAGRIGDGDAARAVDVGEAVVHPEAGTPLDVPHGGCGTPLDFEGATWTVLIPEARIGEADALRRRAEALLRSYRIQGESPPLNGDTA